MLQRRETNPQFRADRLPERWACPGLATGAGHKPSRPDAKPPPSIAAGRIGASAGIECEVGPLVPTVEVPTLRSWLVYWPWRWPGCSKWCSPLWSTCRLGRQHSSARPWAGIRWSEARRKSNRLVGMVMCSPPLRSRRRASFCRWQAWHCRARDAAVAPGRCPASIPETGRLAVELLSFG